jgi:pantothenate kinase
MDGWHLANAELERLGRRDRKGAPDTFDADRYAALLDRVRTSTDVPVYAPAFDRRVEEPVAGSIAVLPGVPLVVTEGNYLLLDEGRWKSIPRRLDEVWYVDADEEVRVERLIRRHVAHGKTPAAARRWVLGSDARNAAAIAPTRARADLVVALPAQLPPLPPPADPEAARCSG